MARIGLGTPTGIPVHNHAPTRGSVPVARSPVFGAPSASSGNFSQPRRQAAQRTVQARRAPVRPYVPRLAHPTQTQRRVAATIRGGATPLPAASTTRYPIRAHAPMAPGIMEQQARQVAKRLIHSAANVDYSDPLAQYLVRAGLVNREEKPQWHIPILQHPAPVYKSSGRLYPTDQLESTIVAPAVKALAQTARPVHALAEATDALIKHQAPLPALAHGFMRNPTMGGVTFSDVLRDAGVHNKAVRGVAGFGLDVGLDPTTYLTFGAGSVARKAALDAGESAARRAIRAGLTKDQAEAFRARAIAQATPRLAADTRRGVYAKLGKDELPGMRRATAAIGGSRPVRAVAAARPVRAARSGLSDVNPGIAAEGVTREGHAAVRGASRTARASQQRAIFKSRQQAVAFARAIPKEQHQAVIDAIEANDLRRLPAELRAPAKRLRDQFRYTLRLQRQAGIGRTHELVVQDPGSTVAASRSLTSDALASAYRGVGDATHGAELRNITASSIDSRDGRRIALHADVAQGTRKIGRLVRIYDPQTGVVRKEVTQLEKDFQQKGIGSSLSRAEESALSAAGVRRLETMPLTKAGHALTRRLGGWTDTGAGVFEKSLTASTGHARGYFPHALDESLQKGQGFQGHGARQITVDANRGRAHREPLAVLRQTNPGLFSENAPLVFANRLAATHRAVSKAELNRNLATVIGRPARAGETLGEHEQIFHLVGSDLLPVKGIPQGKDIAGALKKGEQAAQKARKAGGNPEAARRAAIAKHLATKGANTQHGRYVVLDKRLVEQAHSRLEAVRASGLLRGYDRVQGGFKRIATGTPGFHVRNLIGDLQNAYLGQPARHLAVNLAHSRRAITRLSHNEARLTKDLPGIAGREATTRGVKIAGKLHTYDQLAHEAQRVGAIRQGFIGRELEELAGADRGAKSLRSAKLADAGRATRRWMQNREDFVRFATYIGARKRGMNAEQAAAEVARYHFDYGDLTPFERNVARRALPFYTFSARNIPLQAKSLLTRPGKYAAYEKLLEESAKGFGFQPGYQAQLSEYDQRNVGLPVNAFGGKRVLGVSLPLVDVNEFPTTANPAKLGTEYARRFMSLVTPLIKNPLELGTNYSFFFRRAIESPDSPLVPAPGWVAHIPPGERQKLGIVPDLLNKRTGKKSWGWPGKLNYVARMVPGAPAIVQNMLTSSNRAGQTQADKILGGVAGIRAAPFDRVAQQQAALNALYAEQTRLTRQQRIFSQRGITAASPTPEYTRVSGRLRDIRRSIQQLKSQRGDAVVSGVKDTPKSQFQRKYGLQGQGGLSKEQFQRKYGVQGAGMSKQAFQQKYGIGGG